jgi:hypothetical protein
MSDTEQSDVHCYRCGAVMEDGYATALGLIEGNPPPGGPKLVFVVPGERTSANPIKAFQQGLQGDLANQAYLLRGKRCPACGLVELVAVDPVAWTP